MPDYRLVPLQATVAPVRSRPLLILDARGYRPVTGHAHHANRWDIRGWRHRATPTPPGWVARGQARPAPTPTVRGAGRVPAVSAPVTPRRDLPGATVRH